MDHLLLIIAFIFAVLAVIPVAGGNWFGWSWLCYVASLLFPYATTYWRA